MPHIWAGTRIEPPPSDAIPPGEQYEEIAAASPPLDPLADRVRSHGFAVQPVIALSVS
jgi:hypothetical protein